MAATSLYPTSPLPVSYIALPHKPTVKIAYTFVPVKASATSSSFSNVLSASDNTTISVIQPLVIFLTGLGLPAVAYHPTITLLSSLPTHPALLTYDRYGQGATTDRDSLDTDAEDPKHGHTVSDVVLDLHHLVQAICATYDVYQDGKAPPIVLVGSSIGCAIARVYAASYPNSVCGLLLLDSVIANTDFVSLYPDPEKVEQGTETLPDGVTINDFEESRAKVQRIFHPEVGSAEGLSRRNLRSLLPDADRPRLVWHDEKIGEAGEGKGPWVTVVGHGRDKFAEESFKMMGIPVAMTKAYTNPHWHEYNIGLTKITSRERARGPIIAENAGHFVHKDDPALVVEEVQIMLRRIGAEGF